MTRIYRSMASLKCAPTRRLPRRWVGAFAVVGLAAVQAAGSAPTPVYHLYERIFALSPGALAFIFGLYPIGLLAALLTVGSLSDHIGRRPCMFGALLLSAAAMMAFIKADSATALMVSRFMQGCGTGAAASCLGAAILDINPERGSLINSVTAFMGTGIGALGSSVLVAFAPYPTHLVYAIAFICFVGLAVVVYWLSETTSPVAGAWHSLRPHVSLPAHLRRPFLLVSPVNIAGWALGGFYLSLMPSLLRAEMSSESPIIGGAVVSALMFSGAIAMLVWRSQSGPRILPKGALILAAGVTLTLVGVYLKLVPLLITATLIAGFGFGASFFGAARSLLPLAAAHERAGVLSAFYVESYLAFSLPAIAVGFVASRLGLTGATYIYGAVLIFLALASFVATRSSLSKGDRVEGPVPSDRRPA